MANDFAENSGKPKAVNNCNSLMINKHYAINTDGSYNSINSFQWTIFASEKVATYFTVNCRVCVRNIIFPIGQKANHQPL